MNLRILLITLLGGCALQAAAFSVVQTNLYRTYPGQTVEKEQWVSAQQADLGGHFLDDLFIVSQSELILSGTFEDDIWGMASGDVRMDGVCGNSVRIGGRSIQINGSVEGNLLLLADTIILSSNSVVGGDVKLIGSSIILEGNIYGDASITAARIVTLGGMVEGNMEVVAPDILLDKDTRIEGNLTYMTNKELLPTEGMVGGTLDRSFPAPPPGLTMAQIKTTAFWFLAAFMAGVPFISFFPMTTAMAAQLIRRAPWKCMLVGFITSISLFLIGILCMASIIGLPLGVITLGTWAITLYLSRIIVGLVLGTTLLRQRTPSLGRVLLAMGMGLAIIYLATLIPTIGPAVKLVIVWLGMGGLILALFQKHRLVLQVPQASNPAEPNQDKVT